MADLGFRTQLADFGFRTLVSDFGFRTLVALCFGLGRFWILDVSGRFFVWTLVAWPILDFGPCGRFFSFDTSNLI